MEKRSGIRPECTTTVENSELSSKSRINQRFGEYNVFISGKGGKKMQNVGVGGASKRSISKIKSSGSIFSAGKNVWSPKEWKDLAPTLTTRMTHLAKK